MRGDLCCTTAACISTIETRGRGTAIPTSANTELTAPRALGIGMPRFDTPLVPRQSIAGRALVAVVAIMTFLASLTMGAVILVGGAASSWQSDVAREVTIQVIPAPGRRCRRDGGRKRPRPRTAFPASRRCGPTARRN